MKPEPKTEKPESKQLSDLLSTISHLPTGTPAAHEVSFSVGANFKADAAAGTLTELALITAEREALGHGLYIDARTLETALASVKALGGKLRAYIRHLSWGDYIDNGGDRVLEMPGYFEGLKIDGDKLVAESFTFFDSFKEAEPAAYARLMEMAQKTPELFGLSIEAYGYGVYVDEDGNEYGAEPEDTDLLYDGLPAFRVTRLTAAAFVDQPAANDGLFSQVKRAVGFGRPGMPASTLDLLAKAFVAFQEASESQKGLKVSAKGNDTHATTHLNQKSTSKMDKLIEALRAKYGDDQARLSRALLFVTAQFSAKKELSEAEPVDAVAYTEAHLKAEDDQQELADLRAKAKKADDLEAENATLKTERDDLATKFSQIKESGVTGGELNTKITGTAPASRFTGATREVMEFQAARGRYNLAATDISDLWVPQIWLKNQVEMVPTGYSLLNTGVIVTPAGFRDAVSGGGQTVNVPLLHEADFVDEVQDGSPTVNNLDSDTGVTPFFNRVNTLGWNAFARTQSGLDGDIVGAANQSIVNMRYRNRFKLLLDILAGYFGTTGSGALASLRNDNFDETGNDATSAQQWSRDMFHDAKAKLSEVAAGLQGGAILCHPDIEAAMSKQDDITTLRDSDGRFLVNTYAGLPVIVSNLLRRAGTTNGYVYTTYILGPGSIGMADRPQSSTVGDQASFLTKEDEAANDVVLYDRTRFLLHPNGGKFVGAISAAKSGPTNAEVNAEADWETVLDNVENAGMVQIKTNG